MANSESGKITLPADVAELVHSRFAQGGYATDADVLRDAMRALDQQDKLRALRAMVDASINDPRPRLSADEVDARLDLHAQSYGVRGDHA